MGHDDIRIGTLVGMSRAVAHLPQLLPHGFESFGLTFWQKMDVDLKAVARQVNEIVAGKAVISAIGFFGNPLMNPEHADGVAKCIEAAHLFGCHMVNGFAGAIEGKPLPESMPAFKKVWGELARRAEDKDVKIVFENCDMGGNWQSPHMNIANAPTAWEMMFNEVPSPALGLEWEPCHQMVSLVDPIPQLRKWIDKIYHVHGKDATIAWDVLKTSGLRGGKQWVWHRTPGFGDTNWTDVISILRMNKWKGCIDIEGFHDPVYHGDLEYTGQVHALNYLKQCRGGAFVANPK